ncbi:MAG: hypothetical protein JNL32_01575 [Candidatus Kapabacteria bacterium]|nr:hypothetical protein [Candidatus Kapabacteria bacterium]
MKVNWEVIKSADGYSEHVPLSMKLLCSSNEDVRDDAYWRLDNSIVLQGYLFESSFYAVELILEILEDKDSVEKENALELLYQIAAGCLGGVQEETMILHHKEVSVQVAVREKLIRYYDRIKGVKINHGKPGKSVLNHPLADPETGIYVADSEAEILEIIIEVLDDLKIESEKDPRTLPMRYLIY